MSMYPLRDDPTPPSVIYKLLDERQWLLSRIEAYRQEVAQIKHEAMKVRYIPAEPANVYIGSKYFKTC